MRIYKMTLCSEIITLPWALYYSGIYSNANHGWMRGFFIRKDAGTWRLCYPITYFSKMLLNHNTLEKESISGRKSFAFSRPENRSQRKLLSS